MASALFKKFQDEQAKKDAEYKAWEADQWKQHGALWEKEGYKRLENSNKAWGSTWSFKNPVINPPIDSSGDAQTGVETKPEAKVETKPEIKVETEVETPAVETPTFASYDDLMQQKWARKSVIGSNNGWVDENGKFIVNHDKHTGKKFLTFVTTNLYGDHNDVTYAYDPETGTIRAMSENMFGKAKGWAPSGDEGSVNNGGWGSLSDMLAQYGITYKKQGGTMNRVKYFRQGGQPQNQQADAFMKAVLSGDQGAIGQLIQLANKGDKNATQLIQTILQEEQKGNTQVTKAASVIKQLANGAVSAKWGSKLQYMRSLKYARGGKTKSCPVCEQQRVEMKKCGGKKAKKRYFGGYL